MNRIAPKSQTGFGMLEILITVLVLAIGLLGVAILQTKGQRFSQSSYLRTIASYKAYEMVDRMRANMTGVSTNAYDAAIGTPTVSTDCSQTSCTPAEMAVFDINEWNTTLAQMMPLGQGEVSGSGLGSTFTITVRWDDERTGATGTGCSGNPQVDLACFELDVRI